MSIGATNFHRKRNQMTLLQFAINKLVLYKKVLEKNPHLQAGHPQFLSSGWGFKRRRTIILSFSACVQ